MTVNPSNVTTGHDVTIHAQSTDSQYNHIKITMGCGVPDVYAVGAPVADIVWHTNGCPGGSRDIRAQAATDSDPNFTQAIATQATVTINDLPRCPTPTAPEGVYLFPQLGWCGTPVVLTGDEPDLRNRGIDDSVFSIHVVGPYRATLYRDPNYGGFAETVNWSDEDLTGNLIENTASSVRVERFNCNLTAPGVILFSAPNFNGACKQFALDDRDLSDDGIEDAVYSLKLIGGYEATLCLGRDFTDTCRRFSADVADLDQTGLTHGVSSLRVHVPPPAAASGLQATALDSSRIRLTWTDNSVNEDGFRIAEGGTVVATAGASSGATASFTIGGLAPSSTHCYTVTAFNSAGSAAASGQACATTQAGSPAPTGFAAHREIVVRNTANATLPAGYPVHLHLDGTTTPTAAEVFAAAKAPGCADVRVLAFGGTEVDRYVPACTSSAIDIWFRTQAPIAAGATDATTHVLYYGNAGATTPPGNIGTVFDPPMDANTVGLWYMQEGSGGSLSDSSGSGITCSLDGTTGWAAYPKFPSALHFQGGTDGQTVSCGAPGALNLQNFTFELFFKGSGNPWGRLAGQMTPTQRWAFGFDVGKVYVQVWSSPGGGTIHSTKDFTSDTSWHHAAFTIEGTVLKLYIDGNLDGTVSLSAPINMANQNFTIGSYENGGRTFADIAHVRFSNTVRTSFPYGAFAAITGEPAVSLKPPPGTPSAYATGRNPSGLAFDGANLWVSNQDDYTVSKIRATDGAVLGTFPTPTFPVGVAYDGASIWVVNYGGNSLTKLRPSDGAVLGTFPSVDSHPYRATYAGGKLWVGNWDNSTVRAFNPADGSTACTVQVPGSHPGLFVSDGTYIWVGDDGAQTIHRFRATDCSEAAGAPITLGHTLGPWVFDGVNVWIVNPATTTLTRIRAIDGARLSGIDVGFYARAMVFDGATLWIANRDAAEVKRVRITDGAVLATIPVAAAPGLGLFDGTAAWFILDNKVARIDALPLPPIVNSLGPGSATAGGAAFTLTVNGAGFVDGSQIRWKGAARGTTFVSSTQLSTFLSAADIATSGTSTVDVVNPEGSDNTSNSLTFTITAPTPPSTPANLSATARTATGISLAWDDTSSDETGFKVLRNGAVVATPGANATATATYDDTGLTCGTAYSYTVVATGAGGDSAASNALNTSTAACPATKLVFSTQPTGARVGAPFATQPVITVQDAGGATVVGFTGPVALSVKSGTGTTGALLGGTVTANAVAGVATFSGLSIDKAGAGYILTATSSGLPGADSAPFDVTLPPPAAPTGLYVAAAVGTEILLAWQDNSVDETGFKVTRDGVVIATTGRNDTLNATYIDAGVRCGTTYTYTVTATGLGGDSAPSNTVTANAAACPAPRLAFTTQPGGAQTGTAFGTQPVVTVRDATGATAAGFTGTVTLKIKPGTGASGAVLSGTKSVSAVAGVATFAGLSLDRGGTGYVLTATATGYAAADSAPFDVINPAPTLTSLSPTSANAGGPGLTLTVNGTNFTKTSVVQWNGSPRTTAYASKTKLTAVIPAGDLAATGTATIVVVTGAPGGGTTAAQTFSITDPTGTPDLMITATAAPEPVVNSGTLTYTLTVKNVGGANATGVTVRDTLPAGTTYKAVPTKTNGFTCTRSGQVVTCAGATINAGTAATITITATVTATGGTVTNQAVADPDGVIAEGDETNNAASATSTVSQLYKAVLTWGASPANLDAHLWLPAASPAHIASGAFGTKTTFPWAALDKDDVDGTGPEAITITQLQPGTSTFAVYNTSNEQPLTASKATVKVYRGSTLLKTYTVPTSGAGRWWTVFELKDDGTLVDRNVLADSAPQSLIAAAARGWWASGFDGGPGPVVPPFAALVLGRPAGWTSGRRGRRGPRRRRAG